MSRWNTPSDELGAEIAYALGEDLDVIEYLKQQHHAAGWNGPEEADR
ncbi:hypothetical protein [Halobacterium hubeiense]|nr:hypothetical protein [Halobacterium hubeiense]